MITTVLAQDEHHHAYKDIDYYANPHYEFKYSVHDPKHHDVHEQKEERYGDKVKGEYMLHDPDGTIRIVKYEADKHNGFNAVVERKGHAVHPQHYKTYH
ncbi:adult-specific cuticular protein ACP-20-like [Euwallacea similis]|uniref:adult-specific cuticular protein ACP-20-like n=1 Tax=Euwallacea similis TaxID=1736056 RepID=UPI00344F4F13